jgi:hypothetical protein
MNSYLVTLKDDSMDEAISLCWENGVKIEETLTFSGILVVRCSVEKSQEIGAWDCVHSVDVNA